MDVIGKAEGQRRRVLRLVIQSELNGRRSDMALKIQCQNKWGSFFSRVREHPRSPSDIQ
jgi:hypothetical protein